jgi:hemolysin activation/secretion protein
MIMNTVNKWAKLFCVLLLTGHAVYSQQSAAKNFIGSYAGLDFTGGSYFTGVSYERIIHRVSNAEFCATGGYTRPYSDDNLNLLFYTYNPPVTKLRLGVQGYSFKKTREINDGIFFTAGAGLQLSWWKQEKEQLQRFSPYGELGFGWKWPIGNNLVLRWKNTLGFATRERFSSGEMTLTSTLALGF